MLLILKTKVDTDTLKQLVHDLDGYIKFVVDIEKQILAAGGFLHADAEKLLIQNGSSQRNLWGGGLDLETGEIDYDSMINIRPNQDNPAREVLSQNIRDQIKEIVGKTLIL